MEKNNYLKKEKNIYLNISIIGKGGFGKVWKVFEKSKKTQYALKKCQKQK